MHIHILFKCDVKHQSIIQSIFEYFVWHLCCLFLLDIRILITHLVSSKSSPIDILKRKIYHLFESLKKSAHSSGTSIPLFGNSTLGKCLMKSVRGLTPGPSHGSASVDMICKITWKNADLHVFNHSPIIQCTFNDTIVLRHSFNIDINEDNSPRSTNQQSIINFAFEKLTEAYEWTEKWERGRFSSKKKVIWLQEQFEDTKGVIRIRI